MSDKIKLKISKDAALPQKKLLKNKFDTLAQAFPFIAEEYMSLTVEGTPRKLVERWAPRIKRKFTVGSLCNLITLQKLPQKKKELREYAEKKAQQYWKETKPKLIKKYKNRIYQKALIRAREEQVEKRAQLAMAREIKKQEQHVEFVETELERTQKLIAESGVDRETLKEHLTLLDKQDKLARRTYKMDGKQEKKQSRGRGLVGILISEDAPAPTVDADYDMIDDNPPHNQLTEKSSV